MYDMMDFLRPLAGISQMLIIICVEASIIFAAMGADFVSGYHKAKLRGEQRNSYGLKRTVSKFILYMGSLLIACGIDTIFYSCKFWELIHFSALTHVPVVSSIISVFICVTEIRSIWEKAEDKHRRDMFKTAEMISKLIDKESLKTAISEAIVSAKDKEEPANK